MHCATPNGDEARPDQFSSIPIAHGPCAFLHAAPADVARQVGRGASRCTAEGRRRAAGVTRPDRPTAPMTPQVRCGRRALVQLQSQLHSLASAQSAGGPTRCSAAVRGVAEPAPDTRTNRWTACWGQPLTSSSLVSSAGQRASAHPPAPSWLRRVHQSGRSSGRSRNALCRLSGRSARKSRRSRVRMASVS